MSFRKSVNRHNWWNQYREAYGTQYEKLGVPLVVLASEQRLKDFLTLGIDADTGLKLEQLAGQEFWDLFQIITSTFDYEAETFTAFNLLARKR